MVEMDKLQKTTRRIFDYDAKDRINELIDQEDVSLVPLKKPEDFLNLNSNTVYLIDGIIDFSGTGIQITIPIGGLSLIGWSFDVCKLICQDDNYTLFISPVGGSGNFLGSTYAIEITGTGSKVYDLIGNTGFEAFEFEKINYNNCSSLGTIKNYRQGLETGSGRFGGKPTLELDGTWVGGFRVSTSIIRNLDVSMNTPIFKAGSTFQMNSRFYTDINADLPNVATPLIDFSESNFPNESTIQINSATISVSGSFIGNTDYISPNINQDSIKCLWRNNVGLANTYIGGRLELDTEITTDIIEQGTYYLIAGVWSSSELVHFDSPVNGQLRHLAEDPKNFSVFADFTVNGTANDVIEIDLIKWDESLGQEVEVRHQIRQINNLVGSRDVAFFPFWTNVTLDKNDKIYFKIKNLESASDVALEVGSYLFINER